MQRHSALLIAELARSGKADLIVLHPHKEKLFAEFQNVREICIEGTDPEKNYLLECYRYSKRVFNVLKQFPDYIIYSQGLSVWYGIDEIKHKVIINPHGLEPYQALSVKDKLIAVPFRLIFNYLFRKAAVVVSLGGSLTEILTKIVSGCSEIAVLPNAVNLPEAIPERRQSDQILKILFVGRFASNKGINILMQAVKELNEEGLEHKIVYNLAGKGPLFSHYSENYKFKNVNYLGFVSDDDLDKLYLENDLFVLPTLFEGMPTVVLEAMARKMPVIVSNVGATAELVDSTNGYLIKRNSVEELKKAIKDFIALSDEEKTRMAENSFKKVEQQFTWKKVAEKHIALFTQLKKENLNSF
jgi:glycosyltransferase involved in cell wall biosynthesis